MGEEDGLESEVLRGKNMDVTSMDALKKRIDVSAHLETPLVWGVTGVSYLKRCSHPGVTVEAGQASRDRRKRSGDEQRGKPGSCERLIVGCLLGTRNRNVVASLDVACASRNTVSLYKCRDRDLLVMRGACTCELFLGNPVRHGG